MKYLIPCFLFIFCSAGFSCSEKEPAEKFNVLLIITDDQGYGDLSYHNNAKLETPHIDSLAKTAVVFDRFYVSPVCAPSRASLLTGRYHLATGTSWVTHRMEVMREEEVTLAEMLKPAGYRSGLFGKWHQGKQFPNDPIGQGFDEFFGFSEGHLNNYFDAEMMNGFETVLTKGYLPDVLTDKTISFMEKEEQFFAVLSFNTPHSPFQVPDQYFDKYKKMGFNDKDACVYGMVENIDDNVNKIMRYLEESGKIDQTIVIFMTDNGPNGIRYNANMKGIKGHLDEGGVRVPFFMKIPGYVHKTVESWAAHIDILPTLAALLDIDLPKGKEIHGKNLMPLIQNETLWEDRYLFTHHVNRQFDTLPGAIRNQQHILTMRPSHRELYDLQLDPYQKNNIIEEFPDIVADLDKKYQKWFLEMTREGVEPPFIQVGHPQVPSIKLPAPDGKREGNVQYKGGMGWANDWFINFSEKEDRVFWEIKVVEDTVYEGFVQLSNNAPVKLIWELNGEQYERGINEANLARLLPSPDRVPRTEVYEQEWPLISLGKINFEKGETTFSLRFEKDADEVLEVKSVFLKKL